MITGKTKLLGVIGSPIEHSLSPIMHNAAIAEMGLDYTYIPLAIDTLETAFSGFDAIKNFRGFSVTIPHKQTIIPLLSGISEVAQAIGAVNTVWRTEQGWSGTNTDVIGFLAPLKVLSKSWDQSIAVILGNGGAARAVVAGCAQLGFAEVHVVGRNVPKLEAFQQSWSSSFVNLKVHSWETLSELLPHADLLVNTTPIGMSPQIEQSPLTDPEADQIKPSSIAYDLIYVPNPTRFLQQAEQRGSRAIDGLEMLVQQGAAALELWTQHSVPVNTMRRSLRHHLGFE